MKVTDSLNMKFFLFFIPLIIFDMMGESTLYNEGSKGKSVLSRNVLLGVLSYALASLMYFFISKDTPLLVINTFWHMTIFTIMTLMGVFYFKNKLTIARGLGLVFAFMAIGCMVISNLYGY